MKKIYFVLFITILPLVLKAQSLTNLDFENWEFTLDSTGFLPVGWMPYTGSDIVRTTDSYSGNYAVIVQTWYSGQAIGKLYNRGNSSCNFDCPIGSPIGFKPLNISGYYKYTCVAADADSAQVRVILTKYNSINQTRDTVGNGYLKLPAAESYSPFQVDIEDLIPSLNPDTIIISLISGGGWLEPSNCSTSNGSDWSFFYIDNLSINTFVGNKEYPNSRYSIFPNPAINSFTIGTNKGNEVGYIEIKNTLGETIYSHYEKSSTVMIDITKNVPGVYVVSIKTGNDFIRKILLIK